MKTAGTVFQTIFPSSGTVSYTHLDVYKRQPLTTVIGYLSLLHEAPDMPEQQKEKYVKVALDKADRLEKLINELFEITKYNAHTVIIKKENIDLHCLIAQVIDEKCIV